ncbi:DEAD/DEAH box helicase, partial [Candidatus Woesearchaeota archaeon]|nr:DEAD/DEAH box helicase [Candidatus Woesearchaeota archaeon]
VKQPAMYKNFTLDQFQIDAINSIMNNHSVVVSAATGTGKTLIADYIIDTDVKQNKRVIYTAPIKALSNQKFKQFKEEYGEELVGIMTGDVVINSSAPILVMTTEIYRNMLMTKDESIEHLSYIIFDEIHYISDIERGTVWEESVIFTPPHVRFLCLSATIPNAQEFADWIAKIKKHPVDVVTYGKRAVPLKHFLFDKHLGMTDIKEMKKSLELDKYPSYEYFHRRTSKRTELPPGPKHFDLISELWKQKKVPCIYFIFSRAATEKNAKELASRYNLLTKDEEIKVSNYLRQRLSQTENAEQIRTMNTTRLLLQVLNRGVGIHHAGLLPQLKEIVEHLFEQGLVKVLYATETFAVGINMPAKVVGFDSLEKFDGRTFRYLHSKEYFQLAGRAGRRGIDTEGWAVALVDRRHVDVGRIEALTGEDKDPIISQFRMSFNSVLNMRKNHTQEQVEVILKSNFGCFQKHSQRAIALTKAAFVKKEKLLIKLGFLTNDKKLTLKGEFASHIYSNEVLVTELFYEGVWKQLDDFELVLLVCSIMYEEKKSDMFKQQPKKANTERLMSFISRNPYASKNMDKVVVKKLAFICRRWVDACQFSELLEHTNLLEGDLIRIFRQAIDLFGQIRKASTDYELAARCDTCVHKIKREFVDVEF